MLAANLLADCSSATRPWISGPPKPSMKHSCRYTCSNRITALSLDLIHGLGFFNSCDIELFLPESNENIPIFPMSAMRLSMSSSQDHGAASIAFSLFTSPSHSLQVLSFVIKPFSISPVEPFLSLQWHPPQQACSLTADPASILPLTLLALGPAALL